VTAEQTAVDLALLEMAANGNALDAGQASLVRQMCTSGARLQLAIAPAGAGKTTAMRALRLAWIQDGGQVLGLAPSAAAAAVLGQQAGIRADTLAKLTWSLRHGQLPDWAAAVGPPTLVIIDEAGIADTLSLGTAVQFAIDRGASVRLVGDDQQLAAIGAGGVLRDIKNIHGAPCSSPSYTASPTRPKHKPRLPCVKAILAQSASISIMAVFMSVISQRSPRMPSPLGFKIDRPDWTRSCSLRLASSSRSSTAEPVIIVATVPRPGKKCVWGTETGRVSAT
jgi:AAA domain